VLYCYSSTQKLDKQSHKRTKIQMSYMLPTLAAVFPCCIPPSPLPTGHHLKLPYGCLGAVAALELVQHGSRGQKVLRTSIAVELVLERVLDLLLDVLGGEGRTGSRQEGQAQQHRFFDQNAANIPTVTIYAQITDQLMHLTPIGSGI
jgi:hypothetical protein